MALNFATLMADFNGTSFAVAGTGEWGYIPDEWKLAYPEGFVVPNNYAIGTDPFADDQTRERFLKANYAHLRAGGVEPGLAFFSAAMRMTIAMRGTLALTLQNRAVIEDEYIQIAPVNANWADVANDIPGNVYNANVIKFCKRYAPVLVHMMVFAFHARGHHWSPEYNELYDRLRAASFVPSNPGFPLPTNEHLFRLIVHGFGIKPLYAMTLHDVNTDNTSAAMKIRFVPHAPVAGVAHITTTLATVNTMKKEAWWDEFYNKFQVQIAALEAEALLIGLNPSHYHVAAKVFGAPNRVMPSVQANAAFDRLCQFALGYIDHLGRRHSLFGQQAISKKSGGLTGLGEAFSRACDRFGKPDIEKNSMAEFLNQV